jgi:hypothetical protein
MKRVEYWRWRYRDPATGRICRTMFPLTAEEAADLYPEPQPIEGSMVLREVDDEAVDTTPDVFTSLPDNSENPPEKRPAADARKGRVAKHG